MDDERRNRDYSRSPVWDETSSRWRVEIRYPDGSRVRKRLRREREALRLWAAGRATRRHRLTDPEVPAPHV
jgi:hypothetical protein